MLGLKFNNML